MSPIRELVAAIDIGTMWTKAVIGRFTPEGKMEILAYGETLTKGVRNGVVVNIDEAALSIRTVVNTLEKTIKLKVKKTYAGISGQRICNRQTTGYRMTENGEVTQNVVKALMDEAQLLYLLLRLQNRQLSRFRYINHKLLPCRTIGRNRARLCIIRKPDVNWSGRTILDRL